jgi:hypothetical protein
MEGTRVLIKGVLWNGEMFIGRFPTELKCVGKSTHKIVALPAIVMEDDAFVKEVDRGPIDNWLPNILITAPHNILFEGVKYVYKDDDGEIMEDERAVFLNNDNPFTKEDIAKIHEALATLHKYQLMGAF